MEAWESDLKPDTSKDEALARQLARQEADRAPGFRWDDAHVRQLSPSKQDRLAQVPSLLPESQLARSLSDSLRQALLLQGSAPLEASTSTSSGAHPGQPSDRALSRLVPRTNAGFDARQPPARQRLDLRLDMYGLVERRVKGDGSCQFRALADQLYGVEGLHGWVRDRVAWQLRSFSQRYAPYVPGDYGAYCADMARPGTWGDHVTLQAAADHFGLRLMLLTSYGESCWVEVQPREGPRSSRTLYLSFWAEVHYNSVYPQGEVPAGRPAGGRLLGSQWLYDVLKGS